MADEGEATDLPGPAVVGPLGRPEQPTADRYRWMVETVQEVIFEAGPNGEWSYLNPAWSRVLGHDVTESLGRSFLDFVHPDDRQEALDAFAGALSSGRDQCQFEARFVRAAGGFRHLELHVWVLRDQDGKAFGSTGTLRDVTERRRAEAVLEHRATHDDLTGLPNRTLLTEYLVATIEGARQTGEQAGLLFLDLDRFKLVNDGVGHDVGDEVLAIVASRMRRTVRSDDIVARFGGDEFVVLAPRQSVAGSRELAARLRAAIGAPMIVREKELTITASVGIRVFDPDGADRNDVDVLANRLLRDADSAMYRAKESGRDRATTFDLSTRRRIVARLETETLLRRALERRQLELWFQPQVRLDDRGPVGIEALLRWDNPTQGMVGPAAFVPVAEETGLIVSMGRWVLEQVCELVATRADLADYRVSVNVSARQLTRSLVADVAAILASTGADPARLCLELTETAVMQDAEAAHEALVGLAGLGVRLSLDDFGTGFSSLGQLQRLPLTEVKIDRSFVSRLGSPDGHAIATAIIGMARALGLETVAEGVERAEEATVLTELDCHAAQGFLYARPAPLEAIPRLLERLTDER